MSDNPHPSVSPIMFDAMRKEWELAHAPELERYRLLLGGIASTATHCPGCRLMADMADEALKEWGRR